MTHDDDWHTTHVNPRGGPRPEPSRNGPHLGDLVGVAVFFGFFAFVGLLIAGWLT